MSWAVEKDYNKKQHQSPTHKSYKDIGTRKKADVSVLQKMRAANLSQSFKTLILSEYMQAPSEMNWSSCVTGDNTWSWRRGFVWSDIKVTAGGDIGEDTSVWVLCQMNNAIGQRISDVPSVRVGQCRSCVIRRCCVACVHRKKRELWRTCTVTEIGFKEINE